MQITPQGSSKGVESEKRIAGRFSQIAEVQQYKKS